MVLLHVWEPCYHTNHLTNIVGVTQELTILVHHLKALLVVVCQMVMSVRIRLDSELLLQLPLYTRSLLFILLQLLSCGMHLYLCSKTHFDSLYHCFLVTLLLCDGRNLMFTWVLDFWISYIMHIWVIIMQHIGLIVCDSLNLEYSTYRKRYDFL